MKRREFLAASGALASTLPLSTMSRNSFANSSPWADINSTAPYLANNFAPVQKEITATNLPITGELPKELNGRYLRNGPNPIGPVDLARHHWFSGQGMIHGVKLEEGKAVWYRNRWVRNESMVAGFGEDLAGRNLANSNNTHIIGHADRTWALVESGPPPMELSYELDTIGVNNFFGSLTDYGFTAHPKIDPDTGDLHAMCYKWPAWQGHIMHVHVGRDGRVKQTTKIPVPGMIMVHDMSLTENYVVIYDLPVTINSSLIERGMNLPFAWDLMHEPRIGLLPRNGDASEVIWSPIDPCYVFHAMNAYEDSSGQVVLDVCKYDSIFLLDNYGPFGDSLPTLHQWTVNPKTRKVSEVQISDRTQEFPRCHPDLNSKPYRYGYAVAVTPNAFPSIIKHDLKTGESMEFKLQPGQHSGEAFFIPREHAKQEDDGFLMSYVYDTNKDSSFLQILDAQDFSKPLAQVQLPQRVPYGFHGSWIADGYSGPSV